MKKRSYSFDFLRLALIAFLALTFELLVKALEMKIYNLRFDKFNVSQQIIHILILSIFWYLIYRYLKNRALNIYRIDIMKRTKGLDKLSLTLYIILLFLIIIIGCFDWNGLRPIKEFQNLGLLLFIFKYIYYFFELLLCLMIIYFGQIAGNIRFKNKYIPWGGILLVFTWGISHIITVGLMTGITSMLLAMSYGVVFILTNYNFRFSFILIYIMFIF